MEIIAVLVVKTVKHGDVLEQLGLVGFEGGSDAFHIDGNFAVTGFHAGEFILRLAEQTGKALGFF